MRVHVPLSSRTRYSLTLKLSFLGVVNDNTLSKLLLNSHVEGFHLANMPRIMLNFVPRFPENAHQETTFFVKPMFIHLYIQQKYILIMRKYLNSRLSTSSICASNMTADKVLDATGRSTTVADKEQDAARWCTLTTDIVLATIAEILSRPTKYFRNLRKYRDCRQSMRCNRKEYYNGRQSTRCDRIEYTNGRQSSCYDGRSTLTAVGVSQAIFALSYLEKLNKFNLLKI